MPAEQDGWHCQLSEPRAPFFASLSLRAGSTIGKQRSSPTRAAAPPTRKAYHGHLSHDTGWTAVNSKQPLVAGNRNGEKCRGTRRPADPNDGGRRIGKIATHRSRSGLSV